MKISFWYPNESIGNCFNGGNSKLICPWECPSTQIITSFTDIDIDPLNCFGEL